MAVFVPMSAVGDKLSVRIVKVQTNLCYGIIEEILTPSPMRIRTGLPGLQEVRRMQPAPYPV